jgi:F0F1-type ATP synthase assembly protein I
MIAYLLLVLAVLSRVFVLPHPEWMNFTAVTAALLYFGARRPWREMVTPLMVLMATDYCLTVYAYHYPFHWQMYVPTWIWYAAGIVLGQILLHAKTNFTRVAASSLLGPTAFFLVSNYAVWVVSRNMYPPTLKGLMTCFAAGIPFYRNDLVSTAILLAVAFGAPVLVRRMQTQRMAAVPVRK